MGLSIITPHFNDFSGIKRLYDCFQIQTSELWQWIIVDDCSDMDVKNEVESFFFEKKNNHIHIIFSKAKTNASHCRNLGASQAQYDNVVFLDSDDYIFPDFVANRLIEVKEFCVFLNIEIKNYRGDIQPFSNIESDFLDNFLKARFAWQTTAVLWNKAYFDKIKGFDDKLTNLQDIEISIKALFQGKNYRIITNNEVDFQYFVTPINTEKRTIFKITQSVIYLLKKLVADYNLSNRQLKYLRGYYFLCV